MGRVYKSKWTLSVCLSICPSSLQFLDMARYVDNWAIFASSLHRFKRFIASSAFRELSLPASLLQALLGQKFLQILNNTTLLLCFYASKFLLGLLCGQLGHFCFIASSLQALHSLLALEACYVDILAIFASSLHRFKRFIRF